MLTAKPVVRGHAPSFDLVAEQLHKDPWFLRCGAFCCRRYCGWVFALALTLSVGIGLVLVWDPPYAVSGHKPNTTEMLGSVISRTQQNAAAAVDRLEAVQDALHADATPEELLHRLDRLGLLDAQMQGQMLNLQQTLAAYSFANGTHQSPEGNASSTSVIAVQVQQLSQNSSWENLTAEAIDSRQFVFSGNWKFDLFRFAHHGGDAAYMMRPMATAGRRMQAKAFETVRNSFAQLSKSWRVVLILISIAGACGLVFSMNAGPWGRQGPHPPQQHQRQNGGAKRAAPTLCTLRLLGFRLPKLPRPQRVRPYAAFCCCGCVEVLRGGECLSTLGPSVALGCVEVLRRGKALPLCRVRLGCRLSLRQ